MTVENNKIYQNFLEKELTVPNPYDQGFYTSKGRFVNREEAAKIAFVVGQISEQKKRLFSEDLY